MTPLGLIVSSFFVPWLAKRFGPAALVINSVWLATFDALADRAHSYDIILWFPLRFLLGAAINPLFVLSEVWMIMLAAPGQRGRTMGIYAAVISAGYAAGPLTLGVCRFRGAYTIHHRHRCFPGLRALPVDDTQSAAEPRRRGGTAVRR